MLVALQPLAVGAEAQDQLAFRTVTASRFQVEDYSGDRTVQQDFSVTGSLLIEKDSSGLHARMV